jgi:hypothetical protein
MARAATAEPPSLPAIAVRMTIPQIAYDVLDLVEHVTHAARGGPPAEEVGHHVGVEMPGVRHPGVPSWNFGDLSASITTGSRKHA